MQKEKNDRILEQVNQTDAVYDKEATLHRLFEEQAGKEAGRTAATYRGESITYGQLNEKANQLAVQLRTYGIRPNDIVGLMVNRSLDMLIGMFAVLKAGGCYLPIDPKFPGARIDHMLKDSGTKILLTQHEIQYIQSESKRFQGRILYLDKDVYQGPCGNLDNVNVSSDLAYVIYTSGSTGIPKGVMIEHSGIHNFIVGMLEKIAFHKDKKIVSLTTISFDIFVLESLLPLTQGIEILIADPMSFAQDMMGSDVQMLQTTPSTVQLILNDESNCRYFKGLTDIMLGGEAFPPGLLKKLKAITDAKIYNMYGPTETTVWSMVKDLTTTDFITVGQPIANTQIYLADEELNIVNLLEEGEICIGGDGLSRGYLNREELTKQRFVDNKMFPGSKMYRTGDLGRWLANGEVEFLGRIDSQVKIRGFRIELGEIEAAMQKIPEIIECVVAAKTNEEGGSYLVAYYRSEEYLIVSEIILYLKKILPEYEVPGIYMKIDMFPLTPNGKIDRLALPDPKLKRPNLNTEYIKPATELEKEIFEIWSAILGYGTIGIKDNYFDLGGNSILVSQLQVELEKKFQMKIEVAELFSNNTIEQQCTLLSKGNKGFKLQGIILPDYFYSITGEDSRHITEHNVDISREVRETIKKYASALELDVKAVYLALFFFLLAQQTGQDEIELLRMVALEEYIPYCMDVSLFSDLQELCRKVSEDFSADIKRTSVIKADDLQNYHFTDEKAVIITCNETGFCKNSLFENEMNFSVCQQEEMVELKLRSNPHKLNEEEMLKLKTGYLQCIEAVAEAVKEEL